VIEGSLRYPLPIVLGHEAAGVVEQVGPAARGVSTGDHVVLSWNPHCGHCFLLRPRFADPVRGVSRREPKGRAFDGESRAMLADGRDLQQLMFLGCFSEYCIVSDQQAIPVPKEIPFDRACLIGCGVMTGAGAALNLGAIAHGDCVMVIGCGCGRARRRAGRAAGRRGKRSSPSISIRQNLRLRADGRHPWRERVHGRRDRCRKRETAGRGVDVVIESAGSASAFRNTTEAVRPGGQVIWLGKIDVNKDVSFAGAR